MLFSTLYLLKKTRFVGAMLFLLAAVLFSASGHSRVMISGNGQVAQEQFPTNVPMVIQARDAFGAPAPGVPITWAVTQGQGTLVGKIDVTDANGLASTQFVGTTLQPGNGFAQATISATSPSGAVSFVVTTAALRTVGGGSATLPQVELVSPPLDNRNISGRAGTTLASGVVVRVISLSGFQAGQPIPNVGLRIVNADDPTSPPVAVCTPPDGTVLTDATGLARCDLRVGTTLGMTRIAGLVGEFRYTPAIALDITPGAACTFSLSAPAQSIGAGGGSGSVTVASPAGCTWTATSNASWVSINSGANGNGNGTVVFVAAANTGAARSAALTIGGQTFTITQAAFSGGSTALAISTPAGLPGGRVGVLYSTALLATGGQTPYSWSVSGTVPQGLNIDPASGVVGGTPNAAGTYSFTATVRDATGASASQAFTLTIAAAGGGGTGLTITNASLPNGAMGQAYRQVLSSSGGCVNPFGPVPVFTLASGTLPPGLIVEAFADRTYGITGTPTQNGTYAFTLRVTDACGAAATANFSITIGGVGGGSSSLTAAPASLRFTVIQGSATAPASQAVNVTSTSAIAFTAAASTPWLNVTAGGTTPGAVNVGVVNQSTLAAGVYQGSITLTPQGGTALSLPVTLTVTAAVTLQITPGSLTFSLAQRTTGRQDLAIGNAAGVQFAAGASTFSGGNWLSVNPPSGNASTTLGVTADASGLPPGSYLGAVTITPAGGSPQQVAVSLTVTQPVTLTAAPGSLTFTSDAGRNPQDQTLSITSSGASTNFNVAVSGGNWLAVNAATAATPASLRVVVNTQGLAPGSYQGSVTFTAIDGAQAALIVPVVLTITDAGPSVTAVTNGASFIAGPVAPGEFVVIFGSKLGPRELAIFGSTDAVPKMLAETRVLFDGVPAPVFYTSAGQLAAIVPYAMSGRASARLEVEYQGSSSRSVDVLVADAAPGIFVLDSSGQGAVVNEDGTVNSVANGAEPGSIVSIYGTGEGATDPPGLDGQITGDVLARPKLPVHVLIQGQEAEVLYAGSAPGSPAGMLQVNARIPATVPRGSSVELKIQVGTAQSQSGVKLATRP
jgi:uncharacterized protein (TIGR03437 family)